MSARTLLRWQKQLELFPEDLASTLGEMMYRLMAPLGAISLPRDAQQGDVDGFDGIARRGSYERLLPSEWLLRETLPLEFLRRASQAEHTFFQLAHRQTAPTRARVVLFDAGPDQLGACRLAQLALLLLLVNQADSRGETLNWQHVHRIDEPFLHTLDEHSVRAFLQGRTARRSTSGDLQEWQLRFPNHEQWCIGSRRLLGSSQTSGPTISIQEPVDIGAERLALRLSAPGRPVREHILDLPRPEQAARLLRNPFEVARKPATNALAFHRRSQLVLNPSGSRLYYLNERAQLVALAVPNSSNAHSGTARSYQSDNAGNIIGVTGSSGSQYWLCARGSTITLRSNRKAPALVAQCSTPIADEPASLWPLVWFGTNKAAFVTPDRSLWRADFETGRAHVIAHGVRALSNGGATPLVAVDSALEHGDATVPCVLALDTFQDRVLVRGTCDWLSVFLSTGRHGEWLLGVEEAPGKIRMTFRKTGEIPDRPPRESILHPPKGHTVIAVDCSMSDALGFVALDENRSRISLFTRSEEHRLFTASSAISEIVRASESGAFGFVTVDGELGVIERGGQHRLQRQLASS